MEFLDYIKLLNMICCDFISKPISQRKHRCQKITTIKKDENYVCIKL